MAVTKRKRKTNPYRAEVFVEGVRVATGGFPTAALAHRWHDETKKRYEAGKGPVGELTLGAVIDEYKEKELARKRNSTRRRARLALSFIEEAPTAKVRMSELNADRVDELMAFMRQHKRADTRDRWSFDEELKYLRCVCSYFRDEKDETFAMPVTKRHWRKSRFKGERPKRPDFFIPPDKVMPWLRALLEERDPVFHGIAVVQVLMGYRIGEVIALRWSAVDFDRNRMSVLGTMDWFDERGKFAPTIADHAKTDSSVRFAPIPPMVRAALMAAKGRWPLSTDVFRTRLGRQVRDTPVRDAYRRAFRKVGLEWTGTHVCRHTHATIGLASARKTEVMVSLGHASERETERYAHASAMLVNSVPAAIEELVRSSSPGSHPAQNHAHDEKRAEKA